MTTQTTPFNRPLLGFVAYSGTGKTTLLEKLIPLLSARGYRIALLKHAHHNFDIDIPGKDSYRLRMAGAGQVMIASRKRWALIHENEREKEEPQLGELLQHFDADEIDLLLVEGFKHEDYPKIELRRETLGKPTLHPNDANIIALATDEAGTDSPLPLLDINSPEMIADFIEQWLASQA